MTYPLHELALYRTTEKFVYFFGTWAGDTMPLSTACFCHFLCLAAEADKKKTNFFVICK